jgi:hypothetical protein
MQLIYSGQKAMTGYMKYTSEAGNYYSPPVMQSKNCPALTDDKVLPLTAKWWVQAPLSNNMIIIIDVTREHKKSLETEVTIQRLQMWQLT